MCIRDRIYTKDRLLAPLMPGMEEAPHPRRLGPDEQSYFLGLPPTGEVDARTPVADPQEGKR